MTKLTKSLAFVAVSGLLLSGCNKAATQKADTTTVGELTQEQAYRPTSLYSKPGAAVEVLHNFNGQIEAGEIKALTLKFNDGYDDGELLVDLSGSDGLNVIANSLTPKFRLEGDGANSYDVQVSAANDGQYYLNILATVSQGGTPIARHTTGIVFNVGDGGRAIAAKPRKAPVPSNEVIEMPAQETILSNDTAADLKSPTQTPNVED